MNSRSGQHLCILVIGVRWPPETFLAAKFKALARRGVKISIAANARWQGAGKQIPGVKVIRLPRPDDPVVVTVLRLFWEILRAPRSVTRLAAAIRCACEISGGSRLAVFGHIRAVVPLLALRPGLIHFEWTSAAADWLPFWDLWNCPVVVSCRGRDLSVIPQLPGREKYRRALRAAFEKSAAVHCVSDAIRDDAENLGLDRTKAWVIRPAVDPDQFRPAAPLARRNGPFRIVSVGSLNWWKGYEYALSAVKLLHESGIAMKYEILGAGSKSEFQRVQFAIDDLNLSGHTTLRGFCSPATVLRALQSSDCFLLPSLTEGISNAVLEAMACGLPVITTDCGGMREAVGDGIEGIVVETRDSAGMAVALERLAKDPGLRRRLGEAARLRVLSQFTLARQREEFLRLYESVIRPDHRSRQAARCEIREAPAVARTPPV